MSCQRCKKELSHHAVSLSGAACVDAVPEAIITRAEHMQADYLVMGIAGISKLGSVTEDIISHA